MNNSKLQNIKDAIYAQVIEGPLDRNQVCGLIGELLDFANHQIDSWEIALQVPNQRKAKLLKGAEQDNVVSLERFKFNKAAEEFVKDKDNKDE